MKKPRGYVCCGAPMIVHATRNPSRNLVVRYRKCLACNRRVVTEERVSQGRKSFGSSDGTGAVK